MKTILISATIGMTVILTSCNSEANNSKESITDQTEMTSSNIEHADLEVQGLCEMCKATIETTAAKVKGVTNATWDIESKKLHLDFDPHTTSVAAVSKAIAEAGYETELDKADKAAYEALPGCYKYAEQ